LERIFPKTLKQILKKYPTNNFYIINWPGSFTTIRIGTISLNLIKRLEPKKFNLFNITKINFYKFLVKQKLIPKLGIIYIWQRKKAWLYDFEKDKFQYIFYKDVDQLSEKFFIDKIYSLSHPNKIDFYLQNNILHINFKNKVYQLDIKKLPFQEEIYIRPHYMLEPNICL
jgi:hypothetical protein